MKPTLCFVDTETTGLDPDRHDIWEVGLIVRHGDDTEHPGEEDSYVWQLPVDLSKADPISLGICKLHERRWPELDYPGYVPSHDDGLGGHAGYVIPPENLNAWAKLFVRLTYGAHLVGNVVSFDAERLTKLLKRHGQVPMWHYHIVDVEAMAAGALGWSPPWDSKVLCEALGVTMPTDEELHTALGDAAWSARLYDGALAHTLGRWRSHPGPLDT